MKASAKNLWWTKYQVLQERKSITDFSSVSPSNITQCGTAHSLCSRGSQLRGRQRNKVQVNGVLGHIGGTYSHH